MDLRHDVLPLLKETGQEFQSDEAGQLGAALAYYAMFSIFPLLLLLLAALGFVLRYWDRAIDVQSQVLSVASQSFSPQLGEALDKTLGVVRDKAGTATGIGLVTLLLGASGVFQQLDASFNKIWKAPPRPKSAGIVSTITRTLREKLFSFGMVLSVGFLLLVSLALTGVTQVLLQGIADLPFVGEAVGFLGGLAITLALNTLIFALLFKYLPDVPVRWGDVWVGALVTALIWEVAKRLLALYIGGSSYASAYGAVGTVLVLMAWIYFSSQILFLGAEFTKVFARRRGSPAAQPDAHPATEPPPAPTPAPARAGWNSALPVATGVGLLAGALGGVIATLATLVIGARKAVHLLTRWRRA